MIENLPVLPGDICVCMCVCLSENNHRARTLALLRIIKIRLPWLFVLAVVLATERRSSIVSSPITSIIIVQVVGSADCEEWSSPKDAIFCSSFCLFVCLHCVLYVCLC